MPAMQYAVPSYGYMARPMAEGMPAAMAAAGYPGVQYPPGAFPMQLAMPQHMQQVCHKSPPEKASSAKHFLLR